MHLHNIYFHYYKRFVHRIAFQHLNYFIQQEGDDVYDVIDQDVLGSQHQFDHKYLAFYDAHKHEVIETSLLTTSETLLMTIGF